MRKGRITRLKLDAKKPPKTGWRAFDAMSETERHRAALADADARPATEVQLARARRVPRVRALRQVEDIEDCDVARRRVARGGSRVTLESLEHDLKARTKRR